VDPSALMVAVEVVGEEEGEEVLVQLDIDPVVFAGSADVQSL